MHPPGGAGHLRGRSGQRPSRRKGRGGNGTDRCGQPGGADGGGGRTPTGGCGHRRRPVGSSGGLVGHRVGGSRLAGPRTREWPAPGPGDYGRRPNCVVTAGPWPWWADSCSASRWPRSSAPGCWAFSVCPRTCCGGSVWWCSGWSGWASSYRRWAISSSGRSSEWAAAGSTPGVGDSSSASVSGWCSSRAPARCWPPSPPCPAATTSAFRPSCSPGRSPSAWPYRC